MTKANARRKLHSKLKSLGISVSNRDPEEESPGFDGLAAKYKLWLLVPSLVCVIIAAFDSHAAIVFLVFIVVAWVIGAIISLLFRLLDRMNSNQLSEPHAKAVKEALGATVFLGSFAAIGMLLRGDTVISATIETMFPDGVSLGFIDPMFALVIVVGIWVHTWFRCRA